jgi:hypothetical protein
MTINKTIASLVLASLCSIASAQSDTTINVTVTTTTPESGTAPSGAQHYVGVQANELLRQILNLSNNDTPIDNPYLLTYSVNGASGFGFHFGLGYEFDDTKNMDGQIERETNIDNFSLRFGPEKKFWLGKKWLASSGLDILIDRQKNETTNKQENDFAKTKITTSSKITGWGFGPRFGISFQVSNRIFLGTEMTYYFKKLKSKGEITTSITTEEVLNGEITETTQTEKTDTDDKFKELNFSVPAVLYLVIRL